MNDGLRLLGPPSLVLALIVSGVHNPLVVSACLSVLAGFFTYLAIPWVGDVFVKHGRFGQDRLKADRPVLPESMGAMAGLIYIIALFLFIPVPFISWFRESGLGLGEGSSFPYNKLAQFLGGLLALMSMLFLGFADDVLDIRWRVKIWMPLISSMPLLMVYAVTYGGTDVVVPVPLRALIGSKLLPLGGFYYAFMAALAIFSTNAINILAGVNGVEAGQSLVIAVSIALNDCLQLQRNPARSEAHLSSLYFVLPFIGVTIGFLKHNWYPARAFPGDSYCYFAGMIFAVVGILGNFSKTVLLFMLPQIFNFIYSCPQLFGFVDCPRHRMPSCDHKTNLLQYTTFLLTAKRGKLATLGKPMISLLHFLGLVKLTTVTVPATNIADSLDAVTASPVEVGGRRASGGKMNGKGKGKAKPGKLSYPPRPMLSPAGSSSALHATTASSSSSSPTTTETHVNNLTIMNLMLVKLGPMTEQQLAICVVVFQAACSVLAFGVRYLAVQWVYNVVEDDRM
ncbi:UDP-N-acetylglucosamine--dolichyl-phosphate N-acetylglucosaminephosphotransferase-like protein [Fimicolochytrium jonesii]|uniref:UDP-N-acetylglucosamine--dolichyl-phosphate N-acetylglucosaminephosphotransferase-like protein n=1 Tax=Fimicolochytrium jonesii TaxID=1396493 RepID=UPI0022FE05BA|nr:UDP-N-acetylglucosamine--dolichyl-phosphate N-acetylglucosaminephosphotransferase-like protein [Fimicolochytrium jonesii]KAI8822883.1 UDP-N-acetylglucosamine--dolichyl-phosphate N-acetylglucosaminephosphotransferase-like protein [Fimicolochytrium jonesii]